MNAIRFDYTNWKGEDHNYMMVPEPALSFGSYGASDGDFAWTISGHVSLRDGERRPGRRTFKLAGMKNIEEVPDR